MKFHYFHYFTASSGQANCEHTHNEICNTEKQMELRQAQISLLFLLVCTRNMKTICLMFSTNKNLFGRLTFCARCTKKGIFLAQHIAKTGRSPCYQASLSEYKNNKSRKVCFHSAFRIVFFFCSEIPTILNNLIPSISFWKSPKKCTLHIIIRL